MFYLNFGSVIFQVKAVVKNKNGIDEWIAGKAEYRRCRRPDLGEFILPYDMGCWRQNCYQVMIPACEPVGNIGSTGRFKKAAISTP